MTTSIRARPTLYRGIQMRSRLEADFARFLDETPHVKWEYEPVCFAGSTGQYLPDFRIGPTKNGTNFYVEIKPIAFLDDEEYDPDSVLRSMTTIWESEPDAKLELWFWKYGGSTESGVVLWNDEDHSWWYADRDGSHRWPGMGQLEKYLEALSPEAQS